jgi:hypothetical protein
MKKIVSIKGFDKNLCCRGYRFEIGETYKHEGGVTVCESGFHAVEYGIDAFSYYAPCDSRYCLVEQSGDTKRHSNDTKIASASITIKAEIKIPQLVQQSVDWIMSHLTSTKTESNTGDQSAATNTGDQSAATNTGYRSAATNTGDRSAATNTGNWSAATNTGDQSAATNTGYRSAATNTGDQSAAIVEGQHSVAISTGMCGKAKACKDSAIVLVHRNDEGEIVHIRCAIAGKDIEADVFYTLNENGEFVKEGE